MNQNQTKNPLYDDTFKIQCFVWVLADINLSRLFVLSLHIPQYIFVITTFRVQSKIICLMQLFRSALNQTRIKSACCPYLQWDDHQSHTRIMWRQHHLRFTNRAHRYINFVFRFMHIYSNRNTVGSILNYSRILINPKYMTLLNLYPVN